MNSIFQITAVAALLWLSTSAAAQDDVYPSGSGVISTCSLSTDRILIGDTLEINRLLVNGSGDSLQGLFFSDCLPPSFELVFSSVAVNGLGIGFDLEGPEESSVINTFNSYRWIIDSPVGGEGLNEPVPPGDSVVLTLKIVPHDVGEFDLPLHCVAYSHAGGGFAVSQSLSISVTMTSFVDDDPTALLPRDFFTSLAYPNPFNGEVHILFSGLPERGLKIRVTFYNAVGQKVDEVETESADTWGLINWNPAETVGSGLYLYRISVGDMAGSGKIILLK